SRLSGDGFDAPDPRRNAALVHDLTDPDIAGTEYVRAAAQLSAKPRHAHHPHLLAIFFTEQRHGAGGDRLFQWPDISLYSRILQDLLIHEALDFLQLRIVQ